METSGFGEPDLVITRSLDAPAEVVWRYWTEPEYFKRWWGPEGFTCPVAEIDLREGGRYLNAMRSPDGEDYWSTGVYEEIVPMERLVLTDSFADENGNVVPASFYDMPDDIPLETSYEVTFAQVDGITKMTLRGMMLPGEMGDQAKQGWEQSFDKLAQAIATEGRAAA
ncbi:MAG: SRPBCC family protein [Candidatus Geothermincolia bacterium]